MPTIIEWGDIIEWVGKVVIIGLAIAAGIGVLFIVASHVETRMVTGQVINSHYSPGYYTTKYEEVCTKIGNNKICSSYPISKTYHEPTYGLDVFGDDFTWYCSVDEYTYNKAIQYRQTTCEGMRWK